MKLKSTISALALVASASAAFAECGEVVFSDVGWTDITATTAATTVVLEALGYDTDIKVLSVPVTYTSMANGDIDFELVLERILTDDDLDIMPPAHTNKPPHPAIR